MQWCDNSFNIIDCHLGRCGGLMKLLYLNIVTVLKIVIPLQIRFTLRGRGIDWINLYPPPVYSQDEACESSQRSAEEWWSPDEIRCADEWLPSSVGYIKKVLQYSLSRDLPCSIIGHSSVPWWGPIYYISVKSYIDIEVTCLLSWAWHHH